MKRRRTWRRSGSILFLFFDLVMTPNLLQSQRSISEPRVTRCLFIFGSVIHDSAQRRGTRWLRVLGLRFQESDYINSTCLRRAEREEGVYGTVNILGTRRQRRRTESITPIYNEQPYALKRGRRKREKPSVVLAAPRDIPLMWIAAILSGAPPRPIPPSPPSPP